MATKNFDSRLRKLEDRAGLREKGNVYTSIKLAILLQRYYMIFPEQARSKLEHKSADWDPPASLWRHLWVDDAAYERVLSEHRRFVNCPNDPEVEADVRERLKNFHPDDHFGWHGRTMREIREDRDG